MQALSLGLQPGRRLPASTVADMSLLSQPPGKSQPNLVTSTILKQVYHFSFMLIIVCSYFPEIEAVSKGGFPW